jgi:hypothetical protein
MAEDNVELVKRLSERLNRSFNVGEPAPELIERTSAQLRIDASRRVFNPAVYEGTAGLHQVIADVCDAWEGFGEDVERIVAVGEKVVVLSTISGRGRASGVEVATKAALVWTIRDGIVEEVDMFNDHDEALRSVGLPG